MVMDAPIRADSRLIFIQTSRDNSRIDLGPVQLKWIVDAVSVNETQPSIVDG